MANICYFFGKRGLARQRLLLKMMENSSGSGFLHIVPTKGRVMELETDPQFWARREANTLSGIIHRIFEEEIHPLKYADHFAIDQMVSEMLIKKAIHDRGADDLAYFSALFTGNQDNSEFTGICRNISGFISTLYQNNYEDIFANDLGHKIIKLESERPGTSDERYALEADLLWLFGDYEELKREIRGYDSDDINKDVRDFLKTGNRPSCLNSFNIIILDSLTHITRVEEEILFHLIEGSDELWWLIDYDSDGPDPVSEFKVACGKGADHGTPRVKGESECCRAYYSLVSLIERLQAGRMPERFIRAEGLPSPNPYADALYAGSANDVKSCCTSLKIGAFNNQADEVRAIASKIKWILSCKGEEGTVRPGDIRVIFPDLTDYAPIVSEIFTEYGLPFSLTKGIPLSSHPLSDIYLRIMELPECGFKRENLFNLFSSALIAPRYMGFDLPAFSYDIFKEDMLLERDTIETVKNLLSSETIESIKGPDIYLFDMVMRRCRIKRLGQRLECLSDEGVKIIRGQYLALLSEGKGREERAALRQEYYLFLYQRLVFTSILSGFILLLDAKTSENIIEGFRAIIKSLGFPLNILDMSDRDTLFSPEMKRVLLKRDIRAFTLLNELLASSQKETKLAQRLFDIKKSNLLFASFLRTFRNRIDQGYLHDERNPDVIRVSQMLEIRGRSFDYLFAGGFTSGMFPFRERPDFIIPEASRGIFRIINPFDQAKQLFSSILKDYNRALFLSYPRDIAEKPVQPSQVIQDLLALISDSGTNRFSENSLSWPPVTAYTSPDDLLDTKRLKWQATDSCAAPGFKNIIIKEASKIEDITRGIKSVISRTSENGLFEYDGILQQAKGLQDFQNRHEGVYSPSGLETLANCPMRYLFRYILNLKDPDEILRDATQRDIGSFVHEILNRLFRKFVQLNTNVNKTGIKDAFALAGEIIENCSYNSPYLKQIDFSEFHKQELFAGLDPENKGVQGPGIIASLLLYENDNFKNKLPEGIEFEFGRGDARIKVGDIFVKGFIDRFDRDADFPDKVHIYDYKTGYIRPSVNIKKGLSFQLPLYIRAIHSMDNNIRVSASYYPLKKDAFKDMDLSKHDVCINSSSGRIDITGVTLIDEFVTDLAQLINKGQFHHSADGQTCEYCSYRYACYMNKRRMDYLTEMLPELNIYSGTKNQTRWQKVDEFKKEWKGIKNSMEKADTLKTPSGRKRHMEAVMEFRDGLDNRKTGLPLTAEYMDGLREKLDQFISRSSLSNRG